MAVLYQLERTQFLPVNLSEAWDFFSTPDNLVFLTPPYLSMVIKSNSDITKIHPGQIISYRIKPFAGFPVGWVTEITHVKGKELFVDEQRLGPFAFWHHTHFFREIEGGVEMRDLVHYRLPLGILGRFAHSLFVRDQLQKIFDFRKKYLENRYA